jgi:hypothetical protein
MVLLSCVAWLNKKPSPVFDREGCKGLENALRYAEPGLAGRMTRK